MLSRGEIIFENIIKKIIFSPWPIWNPIWKFQSKKYKLSLPIAAFLISTLYISIIYALSNNFADWRGYTIFSSTTIIDENIPFIKNSIYIYGTYYFLFIAMALSVPLNKKGLIECIFAYQILMLLSTVCFIIFVLMPIKVDTRIGLDTGEGLVSILFEILHSADPPYNSWPSLHVLHSIFLSWILIRWIKQSQGLFRIPSILSDFKLFVNHIIPISIWTLSITIAISTMTTKQHYFFDFITGIIFAVIGILILKKCIDNIEKNYEKIIEQLES